MRCSNSYVVLSDGQTLFCENTVEDIDEQLSISDTVLLDLSEQDAELPVHKQHIVNYNYTD
jgi:hypothetical protein